MAETMRQTLVEATNLLGSLAQQKQMMALPQISNPMPPPMTTTPDIEALSRRVMELERTNRDLKRTVDHFRMGGRDNEIVFPAKRNTSNFMIGIDDVDARFNQELMALGYDPTEVRFQRIARGKYAFQDRKVSMRVVNGGLVCRVGGGFLTCRPAFKRPYLVQQLPCQILC